MSKLAVEKCQDFSSKDTKDESSRREKPELVMTIQHTITPHYLSQHLPQHIHGTVKVAETLMANQQLLWGEGQF